jgi:hypothetical protein
METKKASFESLVKEAPVNEVIKKFITTPEALMMK